MCAMCVREREREKEKKRECVCACSCEAPDLVQSNFVMMRINRPSSRCRVKATSVSPLAFCSKLQGTMSSSGKDLGAESMATSSELPERRQSEIHSANDTRPSQKPSSCNTCVEAVRFATNIFRMLSIWMHVPHPWGSLARDRSSCSSE